MSDQLTNNPEALRLFFTEEIYLVKEKEFNFQNQSADVQDADAAIEPEIKLKTENPSVKLEFDYIGKNQRNILILVNDPDRKVSSEQGRELLLNILKAINLTVNDYALVNYSNYSTVNFITLKQYFSSKIVLVFGIDPAQLSLPVFPQNSLKLHEATHLIFSSNLNDLAEDQHLKKVLWTSLKQLSL